MSKEYYDGYVKRQKSAGINRRHYSIMDYCIKYGIKRNNDVLEIGCGIGTFSSLLSDFLDSGNLLAVDISPKSIEQAMLNFSSANTRFEVKDLTEVSLKGLFDFVVLPDVLEHIPIEKHKALFNNLSKITTYDAVVLIHIPNPHYLSWVIENENEKTQFIDQPLFLDKIFNPIDRNGFYIHHLENYSLWYAPEDYQVIVLKKKKKMKFNLIKHEEGFGKKIKNKIKSVFPK